MANSTFGTNDPNSTGTTNVNNAASSGNSAVSSFDPNAWQTSTQQGLNGITSSQAAGNQSLVNAFKNQIASQPSATDYYNQGMAAFNVQPLQATANTLNNAVLQAPTSNLNAAKGFNYDNNQVQQKTSQDLQYLTPQANAAQNNATTAQNNAIAYQNAGLQQNTMNMTPYQQQATAQAQLYAQQYSGFTATAQAQLTALQDKMNQGVALSTAEMSAYASLTSSEQAYQSSLATANAGVQQANIKNQFQTVPGGQNLVNTFNNTAINPGMLTQGTGVASYG